MKKIDKYYFEELLRYFVVFLVASVAIFIIVNFFERLGYFIANKARVTDILMFYFFQIPFLLNLMAPFTFLIASFFLFQQSAYKNELLLVRISGIDLRLLILKTLLLSFVLSILVFLNGEFFAFPGLQNSTRVRKANIEKSEYFFYYPVVSDFSFMSNDTLFYFSRLSGRERKGLGVIIMVLNKNEPVVRIDADSCLIIGRTYELFNVKERYIRPEKDSIVSFQRKVLTCGVSPFEVIRKKTEIEEMSARQLLKLVSYKKRMRLPFKEEMVELLYRFSFPLTVFIFAFFSLPLAISIKARGKTYSFGLALIVSFFFWALIQFFKVSGQAGKMNEFIATFFPLILCTGMGIVPWVKMKL